MDAVGTSTIDELVDKGMVKELIDLFALSKEDFLSLSGFKERKATKTYNAIHGAIGNVEAYRLLNAIDIPLIGESASKKIIEAFGEKVFHPITEPISYEEILAVEDIGEESAKEFTEFMTKNSEKVEELFNIVKPVFKENEVLGNSLEGKKFVITGTLSESRNYFKDLIEKHKGKVSGSVSKSTDYLLAGENAGSKAEKAEKLGIPILSEEEFMAMIS